MTNINTSAAIGAFTHQDTLTASIDHMEYLFFGAHRNTLSAVGTFSGIMVNADQRKFADKRVGSAQRTNIAAPSVFMNQQIKQKYDR